MITSDGGVAPPSPPMSSPAPAPDPLARPPSVARAPRRQRALGIALALATLAAGFSAAALAVKRTLPHGEEAARGVRVDGQLLGPGESPRGVLARLAAERLDRPVHLLDPEGHEILSTTARELGATVDTDRALVEALAVGREGSLDRRLVDARRAANGDVDVKLAVQLPADRLVSELAAVKEELDRKARAARRDAESGVVSPHVEGRWLDAFATAEEVLRAVLAGQGEVHVAFRPARPAASTEVATSLDARTELARFEIRFGGPPGRDRNILRAATALDGVILMPGEEVSFNAEVGPRSAENGFFPAPEIYRGEMREGIGGGSCQVASTIYAAMLFYGLEVVERRNHSRPSGYIRPGLDATVSYPVLDLRAKNPFDFPVLLDTTVDRGVMRARLLGVERRMEVELATETAGVSKFKRKVERAGWLASGASKLKQKGKNGLSIRRTVRLKDGAGAERVVTSMDVYPPTQEIWLVAPGTDPDEVLPPFDGAAAGATPPRSGPGGPV